MTETQPRTGGGIAALRRFRTPPPVGPERCELCGVELHGPHRHLADTANRSLACACQACSMLFDQGSQGSQGSQGDQASGPQAQAQAGGGRRFRTLPTRYLTDPRAGLGEEVWNALDVPVGVVFLFRNADQDLPIALYPGPAGATESQLSAETWELLLGTTPLAGLLAPDTEALLVRNTREHQECYLLPIDDCYALVGQLRLRWQGFDGGAEARESMDEFFGELARRARIPEELAA